MSISKKSQKYYSQLQRDHVPSGEIKKMAKEIKIDHSMAVELRETGHYYACMLATLIFDKKLLTQEFIDKLIEDIRGLPNKQRNYISERLLANQLMKSKSAIALISTWEDNPSPTLRRLFWYYQARLRWTGKTSFDNTLQLLDSLEKKLKTESPEVQWTMNFVVCWIGVYDEKYRDRCIALGEEAGLYKDEKVPKGCYPNYSPEFIRIQVEKMKKA